MSGGIELHFKTVKGTSVCIHVENTCQKVSFHWHSQQKLSLTTSQVTSFYTARSSHLQGRIVLWHPANFQNVLHLIYNASSGLKAFSTKGPFYTEILRHCRKEDYHYAGFAFLHFFTHACPPVCFYIPCRHSGIRGVRCNTTAPASFVMYNIRVTGGNIAFKTINQN